MEQIKRKTKEREILIYSSRGEKVGCFSNKGGYLFLTKKHLDLNNFKDNVDKQNDLESVVKNDIKNRATKLYKHKEKL